MPYVQTAVLEFLKEQNSQCNQIGQSEFQIEVLPQYVSGITEGTGVTMFSHKHNHEKNMHSFQLLQT